VISEAADSKSSRARLVKPQNAQFTGVNEHFWGKRNAAIGLLGRHKFGRKDS